MGVAHHRPRPLAAGVVVLSEGHAHTSCVGGAHYKATPTAAARSGGFGEGHAHSSWVGGLREGHAHNRWVGLALSHARLQQEWLELSDGHAHIR